MFSNVGQRLFFLWRLVYGHGHTRPILIIMIIFAVTLVIYRYTEIFSSPFDAFRIQSLEDFSETFLNRNLPHPDDLNTHPFYIVYKMHDNLNNLLDYCYGYRDRLLNSGSRNDAQFQRETVEKHLDNLRLKTKYILSLLNKTTTLQQQFVENDLLNLQNYLNHKNTTDTLYSVMESPMYIEIQTFTEELRRLVLICIARISKMFQAEPILSWLETQTKNQLNEISLKIRQLQNVDLSERNKMLICDFEHVKSVSCGLGCQLHFCVWCFISAYYSNRTVTFENFNSEQVTPIHDYFLPIHNVSRVTKASSSYKLRQTFEANERNVVRYPMTRLYWRRPYEMPATFFDDGSVLAKSHFNKLTWQPEAFGWLNGIILDFIMRPNADLSESITKQSAKYNFDFNLPCVGVHVRRGLKLRYKEALKFELDEYIEYAEDFYFKYFLLNPEQQGKVNKTIFLVTEEPEIITQAIKNFPMYNFIYDKEQVDVSSQQFTYDTKPYTTNFLFGIRDAHFMLRCQYIVATSTSNYARLLHEMMLTRHLDGFLRYKSLDSAYHAHGYNTIYRMAILSNDASQEQIELRPRDIVLTFSSAGVIEDTRGELLEGYNTRTKKRGKFPSVKVEYLLGYKI